MRDFCMSFLRFFQQFFEALPNGQHSLDGFRRKYAEVLSPDKKEKESAILASN